MSAEHRPSLAYAAIAIITWPVLRVVFRLTASGREHLPRQGGYVLAANHHSNFDPWPLGIPLFPRHYLRFMAKSELFWPPLGWIVRAGGGFKVRRGERDVEAIQTAVRLVREGHVVVMFPEGTRRAKGLVKRHLPRAHTGAARIALEADAPLVPAAISGTDRLSSLPKLRVVYGLPLDLDDLNGQPLAEAAREATDRLMTAILALEESLA
jgi:1-acyl-sn-glycerol-3-phosphate acyltransferase